MTSLFVYLSLSVPTFHFPFVICLSVFLSFCLSVFLSFCLSVFLSLCLSVFLSSLRLSVYLAWFHLSVSLPPCLTVSLPLCLSVYLSTCLSISQYSFVHLFICKSISLRIFLAFSVFLSILSDRLSLCLSVSVFYQAVPMPFCLCFLSDCPYVFLSLFSIRLSFCLC